MSAQQIIDGQVNPEVPINENAAALGQAFLYSHDVTADSGLVVGINGGDFDANTVADATVTGTDNATNYIVAHRTTRAISTATGTTNWNATTTYGRVGRAVFASGVLTYHDERQSAGGIFDHAATAGTGDVVGPGSATSGHMAVFSGTSGKLIADGGAVPSVSGTNTGDETGARVATLLHAASAKTTLVDADEVNGTDSASSFSLIRTTWTNVKAFLKTYFDTLYKSVSPSIASPAYASTLTIDLSTISDGGTIRVGALTGNITVQLSNGTDGQRFTVELTQDGTGSRLVTLSGTYFKFGTDITAFTATTTASKKDRIGCVCTAATTADVVAVVKGF